MPRNFNTAPTQAPELGTGTWDYGDPISTGIPTSPGVSNERGSIQAPEANAWDTGNGWGSPSASMANGAEAWGDYQPAPLVTQESGIAERLRELKDKVVHGMGRKALDAVMSRLPNFGSNKDTFQNAAANLYENPGQASTVYQGAQEAWDNRGSYAEQAVGYAREAGREVAGAGITAAKESVMKYYGLEKDENEKLRVARKLKFGKAVVKTVVNPIGTASSVGTRAGYAARKASVGSAKNQLSSAKEAARNWQPQPQAPSTPDGWGNSW